MCVVQHTRCRLLGATNEELRGTIAREAGADASGWDFAPIADHTRDLRADIDLIRGCALLPANLAVGGFVYDVDTGRLEPAV